MTLLLIILFIVLGLLVMFGASADSMGVSNLDNHCVGDGFMGLLMLIAGIVLIILKCKKII